MNRGQIVIVSIFGVALVAAGFSLSFRYTQTHDVLEFWGPQAAKLIASPDRVELWELESFAAFEGESPQDKILTVGNEFYKPKVIREVTTAPGFLNARSALTLSRNYQWDPTGCDPNWSHALVYSRGSETAVVVLSIDCGWVYSLGSNRSASIAPIAKGLARLFKEQLGS